MDNERVRALCMALPHVAETLNWGHYLVYWAGDREVGGKMFALSDLDGSGAGVLSFHCGAERYHELLENEGVVPAPHLARAHWVMLERWDALRPREIEQELKRAHALILERLPKRTRAVLELPDAERRKLIANRKKLLAVRAGAGTARRAMRVMQGGRQRRRRGTRRDRGEAEPGGPGQRMCD
jgi:predicted DNA-binding protein (MmcQ/YjbR family)